MKREDKFVNKFLVSELIPFEDIQKWYKRISNVTFNDYIMGIISIGLKKWLKQNDAENASKVLMVIPINMRGLPNSINEVKVDNHILALRLELKLEDKLKEAIDSIKVVIKLRINPIMLMIGSSFFNLLSYFPEILSKRICHNFYRGVNITFSNLPLS